MNFDFLQEFFDVLEDMFDYFENLKVIPDILLFICSDVNVNTKMFYIFRYKVVNERIISRNR